MFKLLLIDDNEDLLEAIKILLQIEFKLDICAVNNVSDAMERLKDSDLDLIVSDFNLPDGTAKNLFDYNRENENIPFFLFSGSAHENCSGMEDLLEVNDLNTFIPKPFEENDFFNSIRKVIAIHDSNTKENSHKINDFKSVPAAFIGEFVIAPCQIFIKLADDHMVKILDKGGDIRTVSKKYSTKGVEEYHIPLEQFAVFIESANKRLNELMSRGRMDETKSVEILDFTFDISYQALSAMGIKKYQVEQVNKTIENCLDIYRKEKILFGFLDKINKASGHFKNHSILALHFCVAVSDKLDWTSRPIFEKLGFAAFFHDFSLPDPDLSFYETQDFDLLDSDKKQQILDHPEETVKLLSGSELLSVDARNIIIEHHERPDGKGYPGQLGPENISPLGCLFIICHELADKLIKNNYDVAKTRQFIVDQKDYFEVGNFKRPYQALMELMS